MNPENPRQPLEEAALGIYMHVAHRIKEGYTEQAIKEELIGQGIKPDTADAMLAKLNQSRDNVTRQYGSRNRALAFIIMLIGVVLILFGPDPIIWLVGGLIVLAGIFWLARATLQINLKTKR